MSSPVVRGPSFTEGLSSSACAVSMIFVLSHVTATSDCWL